MSTSEKLKPKWIQWFAVLAILLVSNAPLRVCCQNLICYDSSENAGILKGLGQLKEYRTTDSSRTAQQGRYRDERARVMAKVRQYKRKRCFLGLGYRRRMEELEQELETEITL